MLGHESLPTPPHQYLGLTTVVKNIGEDPVVVVSTHNLFSTHRSHSKEQNALVGRAWIQKLMAMDKADSTVLTNWDKQALMKMIEVRGDKEKAALEAATAKLRPDREVEMHEQESFEDLTKQLATWLAFFGLVASVLGRPIQYLSDAVSMLSTVDTISAVAPLMPEVKTKPMTPQWGVGDETITPGQAAEESSDE